MGDEELTDQVDPWGAGNVQGEKCYLGILGYKGEGVAVNELTKGPKDPTGRKTKGAEKPYLLDHLMKDETGEVKAVVTTLPLFRLVDRKFVSRYRIHVVTYFHSHPEASPWYDPVRDKAGGFLQTKGRYGLSDDYNQNERTDWMCGRLIPHTESDFDLETPAREGKLQWMEYSEDGSPHQRDWKTGGEEFPYRDLPGRTLSPSFFVKLGDNHEVPNW